MKSYLLKYLFALGILRAAGGATCPNSVPADSVCGAQTNGWVIGPGADLTGADLTGANLRFLVVDLDSVKGKLAACPASPDKLPSGWQCRS